MESGGIGILCFLTQRFAEVRAENAEKRRGFYFSLGISIAVWSVFVKCQHSVAIAQSSWV
jgi:hypothetical protein